VASTNHGQSDNNLTYSNNEEESQPQSQNKRGGSRHVPENSTKMTDPSPDGTQQQVSVKSRAGGTKRNDQCNLPRQADVPSSQQVTKYARGESSTNQKSGRHASSSTQKALQFLGSKSSANADSRRQETRASGGKYLLPYRDNVLLDEGRAKDKEVHRDGAR